MPDPVRAFLETLRDLERESEFDTGKGMAPRDDLGGRSAKQWLLDHVAGDFECRRDFGGMCTTGDARVSFATVFLSDEGWGVLEGQPDPNTEEGLAKLAFSFYRMLGQPGLAVGGKEHCLPAVARIEPDLDAVMSAYLGPDGPGMLEAYDNFVAVNGTYRVRSRPSLSGEVVNRIDHEAVFVPAPEESFYTSDGERMLGWTYVVPGDGPAGFAALDPADVLALSAVARSQICLAERGGRVVITAHSGAGD